MKIEILFIRRNEITQLLQMASKIATEFALHAGRTATQRGFGIPKSSRLARQAKGATGRNLTPFPIQSLTTYTGTIDEKFGPNLEKGFNGKWTKVKNWGPSKFRKDTYLKNTKKWSKRERNNKEAFWQDDDEEEKQQRNFAETSQNQTSFDIPEYNMFKSTQRATFPPAKHNAWKSDNTKHLIDMLKGGKNENDAFDNHITYLAWDTHILQLENETKKRIETNETNKRKGTKRKFGEIDDDDDDPPPTPPTSPAALPVEVEEEEEEDDDEEVILLVAQH